MSIPDKSNCEYSFLFKSFGFLFVILLLTFVAVPLLLLTVAGGWLSFNIGLFRFLGLVPIVGGLALMVELAFTFAAYGEGTPAPFDPPRHLVVCGLFRQVRNPGYLGAVIALMGQALFDESAVVFLFALVMAVLFHVFVVCYEEPGLKKRFGKEYEDYAKHVPRWLPKLQQT